MTVSMNFCALETLQSPSTGSTDLSNKATLILPTVSSGLSILTTNKNSGSDH